MRWIEPTLLPIPITLPDVHPLLAQALLQRGLSTPETINAFLDHEV
jgi:hypothetical protein